MRAFVIGAALAVLACSSVMAAAMPAPDKLFTPSAEVLAMVATAKQKVGSNPDYHLPLLQLAPYDGRLEYRPAVGPASLHENEAEVFTVIDGSGVLVTGGTLVNPTTRPGNATGTAIAGGVRRPVAKGDFFLVPENTAHWFVEMAGHPLVLMSLKIPRK